jgi:hypothetical protein
MWLYSRDGKDAPVELGSGFPDLGKSDVLWADVDLSATGEVQSLWEELGIEECKTSREARVARRSSGMTGYCT